MSNETKTQTETIANLSEAIACASRGSFPMMRGHIVKAMIAFDAGEKAPDARVQLARRLIASAVKMNDGFDESTTNCLLAMAAGCIQLLLENPPIGETVEDVHGELANMLEESLAAVA